ncbi:AraC family transcriptional regulator [Vibrio navarrensis]
MGAKIDMLAIPLPFIVTLLLSILAAILWLRNEPHEKPALYFVTLCVLTTSMVGLRWTFDIPLFRLLQPILASFIPIAAWYCFTQAHAKTRFHFIHAIGPLLALVFSLTYPFWQPPIDPLLTLLYVGYGVALIRLSLNTRNVPGQVRISDIDKALRSERLAGGMLLLSASIDGALALDFALYKGEHAMYILTIGHAVLLPILAFAVISTTLSIRQSDTEDTSESAPELVGTPAAAIQEVTDKPTKLSLDHDEAQTIIDKLDYLMTTKEVYLDPDLTLDRLSRKLVIPARQISMAINQIFGRNISQIINEYRIKKAQQLLLETNDSITQIYLNAGFQTKSNFHREFSRITGQTPSEFRKTNRH